MSTLPVAHNGEHYSFENDGATIAHSDRFRTYLDPVR